MALICVLPFPQVIVDHASSDIQSLNERVYGIIDKVTFKSLSQGMPQNLALEVIPVLRLYPFLLITMIFLRRSRYSSSSMASSPAA